MSTGSLSSSSCMSLDAHVEFGLLTRSDSIPPPSPMFQRFRLLSFTVEKMSYILSVDAIRRIFRALPMKELRRLVDISDTLRCRSQEIIDERKEALRKGDQAMLAQVGEGKDIMSICCEYSWSLYQVQHSQPQRSKGQHGCHWCREIER